MIKVIGHYISETPNHSNDRHVYLIDVMDDETKESGMCLQTYNMKNSETEKLGFKNCVVYMRNNTTQMGQRLMEMTKPQTNRVKTAMEKLGLLEEGVK